MRWDLGNPVGMALFNEIKKVAAYDVWGGMNFLNGYAGAGLSGASEV